MITCYVPFVVNNPYALNVRRLLNERGMETLPIKKVMANPALFVKCKVFNFNWFEKVDTKKEYYFKCALLAALKLCGKKVIYTLHNKQPHDANSDDLSLKMMSVLAKKSDIILGMCPETVEVVNKIAPNCVVKLRHVLHPNYIYNYPTTKLVHYREKFGITDEDMVFLFLGFVSPYKNIELLIDTFKGINNSRIKLIIAGNPCSQEYEDDLIKRIGTATNIHYDFRYIPDEEVPCYYNTCDIVILPYHKESSLNSGAVYLSFSLRKTVICPNIGTISALTDKDFVYDYDYVSEEEHPFQLKEAIERACGDFERDNKLIRSKGEAAYEYVKKVHSDKKIADMYEEIYMNLINH